jgi:hypothetical protein
MNLLSRKFIIVLVAIISVTTLGILGRVDPDQYLVALQWLVGIYSASNVISKFAPQDPASQKPSTPADIV